MRFCTTLVAILCLVGCTIAPAVEETDSSQAVATAAATLTSADGEEAPMAESEIDYQGGADS